ncbi:MAG: hypothetical protein N2512_01445, partial [Armatimonadetes bacterium]|nr:hypothetical protein [Armatimonadota bacterium]
VIGMNTMVAAGAEKVGFAIPAEEICKFLDGNKVGYSVSFGPTEPEKPSGETAPGKERPVPVESEEEAPTPLSVLWTVVGVSLVVSLVGGVLAGSLAARATVRRLAL